MRIPLLVSIALSGCQESGVGSRISPILPTNPPNIEARVQVDRSVQTPVPAVDVLWVIDNSISMAEEQAALGRSFGAFINYFVGSGLDYHVGVVSTGFLDPSQRGRLREGYDRQGDVYRWIDDSVSDPVEVFREMAVMGTNGPKVEQGRDQVYGAIQELGLEDGKPNADFYRQGADLAVIVISDEDDSSEVTSVNEFVAWMQGLKSEPDQVSFSSIVGPDGGCPTAVEGTSYLEITRAVGGIEWSICESDWSGALNELGVQTADLKREFYLSSVPVAGSLEVWVETDGTAEGFDEGRDWTYDRVRNSIRFATYVPMPFAEVFMRYEPQSESKRYDD